ncbi:DUF3316 domain-containing protein [Photobacterium sp. TY1-4]|uniref:DUF3316 domain-containing protein n=1 Tax=Photobacterium sp. TY1-4 TaxID=2899122 RepID=UPI0021BFE099|nr:DUF3316 domain-containing protein [Photobacterium sp. TY1-4]UXI03814.1 DUF3316 domain-containing protein [Photobacterium sp. TY1-4]
MIKLLSAVVLAGISLSAHAFSWTSYQDTRHLIAATGDNEAQVTQQGIALAKTIETATPQQLKKSLGIYDNGLRSRSISVEDTQLAVQEYLTASGTPSYQAIVKVNYSYDVQNRSRD